MFAESPRRVWLVLLAVVLLAACSGQDADESAEDTATTATSEAATDEASAEESTAEEPSDEATAEEPTEEPTDEATAEESTAEGGGDGELVVGIAQDLPILDGRLPGGSAASFSALRHIAEPLVFFDPVGEVIPVLAESWEQVEPTRYTFTLREDVTFHNGEPFNAEAAAYSINKAVEEADSWWFSFATDAILEGAEAVDEFTIDVTTLVPTAELPQVLTVIDMVEPGHADADQQNTEPIGTGPFTFVEFQPRSQLVLERYDDYWGDPAGVQTLTFRIIPEQSTRVQALLAGEVQAINSISPEDIARLEGDDATQVASSPTTRTIMIALRGDRPPLDNPLVRQAMNFAVNKQEIVDTLLSGIAAPASGILTEQLPCALTDLGPWPYDPDRAAALLEEAGYANEPIVIAIGAGRYPNDDQVGLAVVDQLQQAGLNIQLEAIDYSAMQTELGLREGAAYDGWLQGWGASLLDSRGMLQAFFGGPDAALPLFYENADFAAAISQAEQSLEDPCPALEEAQRVAWDDAGGVFLYSPVENMGLSANVEGFSARFDEFFFFDDVTVQ